jgi:hypothetical protein
MIYILFQKEEIFMPTIEYPVYKYQCQLCHREGSTGDPEKIVKCQICGLALCYRCTIGSFCKPCFETLPEENQKQYKSRIYLRRIYFISYAIFFFFPYIAFVVALILSINTDFEFTWERARPIVIMLGLGVCPGICLFLGILKNMVENDKDTAIKIVKEMNKY